MAEELLVAEGLVVRAGPVEVSAGERFVVHRGEVVALLGPNGAGKTTLLEALAGLRPARRGRVSVAGGVACLPQRPVLFAGSVERNVAMPLRVSGAGRAASRSAASATLEALGAGHLAGRRASTLSGGEARRVALARLLVGEPDVLLLDEPFGGLDAAARRSVWEDAHAPLFAPGRGVLLVTHDPDEAVALADRVVVLLDGGVAQAGEVDEVFSRPASEAVAGMVGAQNVLRGLVEVADAGGLTVRVEGLVLAAVGEGCPGDEVVCTIRPEAVLLSTGAEAGTLSARNRLSGVVEAIERRAHLCRVTVKCSGVRLVAAVVPRTVEDLGLAPGAAVGVAIKATSVHAVRR